MPAKSKNIIVYDNGSWIEVDISTPAHPDITMKIDKNDWQNLLSMRIGRISATNPLNSNTNYALCRVNGTRSRVHRLIIPNAPVVDHINHDGLDNRRSNLRPCENYQNLMNRQKGLNNTSGKTGVSFCKQKQKWHAYIKANCKKRITLGFFTNIEDAIAERMAAEKQYFGKFACKP